MLAYTQFGNPNMPSIIVIHGLFGSSKNWTSQCNVLSKHYFVVAIDCRNHGMSPHYSTMTYIEMANDIVQLMDVLGLSSSILIGHSMGGKIAMMTAICFPTRVKQQIILDIAPKPYPSHHTHILDAMNSLNVSTYNCRADVVKALRTTIPSEPLCQFLVKNITATRPLSWLINLPGITDSYSTIIHWPKAIDATKASIPTDVIYGQRSDYVQPCDQALFNEVFPHTEMHPVDASHWLHAEKPTRVLDIIQNAILAHLN